MVCMKPNGTRYYWTGRTHEVAFTQTVNGKKVETLRPVILDGEPVEVAKKRHDTCSKLFTKLRKETPSHVKNTDLWSGIVQEVTGNHNYRGTLQFA